MWRRPCRHRPTGPANTQFVRTADSKEFSLAVDFRLELRIAELAAMTATFVRDEVIPIEERTRGIAPGDADRRALQQAARRAGVFAPHVGATRSSGRWQANSSNDR
jgi:hypothetical protein